MRRVAFVPSLLVAAVALPQVPLSNVAPDAGTAIAVGPGQKAEGVGLSVRSPLPLDPTANVQDGDWSVGVLTGNFWGGTTVAELTGKKANGRLTFELKRWRSGSTVGGTYGEPFPHMLNTFGGLLALAGLESSDEDMRLINVTTTEDTIVVGKRKLKVLKVETKLLVKNRRHDPQPSLEAQLTGWLSAETKGLGIVRVVFRVQAGEQVLLSDTQLVGYGRGKKVEAGESFDVALRRAKAAANASGEGSRD
jgi:hypothetical protein